MQPQPFLDPATLLDPYGFYAMHRDRGPVVRVENGARETWLVIGQDAIREALAQPLVFSSRPEGIQGVNVYPKAEELLKTRGFGRVPHVITMDPPRHAAYRGVLGKLLRDKRFHQMRPQIRAIAHELVDGFAPAGRCEFVRDYAWKLSVLVVADLLGVPRTDIEDFKRWSDAWVRPLLQPLSEDEMLECVAQMAELQHYLVAAVESRQREPRDDLLTDIAQATIDLGRGETPLRRHEQLGLLEALIVAANDSTANALSLGMLRLVEFPQLVHAMRDDPKRVERFAEESLRYESAVQNNFRTVREPTRLAGVEIGAGALVFLSWGAANRDPAAFPTPDRFDLDRPGLRSHLAFGGGNHTCAGAALARQELVESFEILLRRLEGFRLDDGVGMQDVHRSGGLVTHGLARLPIRFDVRATMPDDDPRER